MTRSAVRFVRRGQVVALDDVAPTATLLDYLRLSEDAKGTKEGCNEGDCGACTIALGRVRDGRLVYEPVNACIHLVGMADGAEVVTVEDLGTPEALHPVQQAMMEHHGAQCGFCTPGFVMSLFTLYQDGRASDRETLNGWLAGNLCRCTGYRPIADAAFAVLGRPADDAFAQAAGARAAELAALDDGEDLLLGDETRFFAAPASLAALLALYGRHPDAVIVAGATDVGLWITKALRELPKIIWIGRVGELKTLEESEAGLTLGAAVTYNRAEAAVARLEPELGLLWRRIGSRQVRAAGTVGGNVANGSPIGDTPPALIALGAQVVLAGAEGERTLPLEDFFIAYGRQDRRPGEIVARLVLPKPGPNTVYRAFKLSKRFDQDISAVMAGFRFEVEDGRIVSARVAFGGMAATPKRAAATEAALVGCPVGDIAAARAAADMLAQDFAPIDDMRASAAYRLDAAGVLLVKAVAEAGGADTRHTRLRGFREECAHG
ncbi:xanthine dehydrogenase small subunit [Pseudoxanthobacter sp.]|uniref:xanthine dehydrogenase small subunit n=1 Tax=Pseudoxanthobacter sp. TaxID=1925742 RepID=UPI002FDF52A0